MSTLGKSLWLAAGAALDAGATYCLLKKDELDFKGQAGEVWNKTKEYGEELVDKVDDYFSDNHLLAAVTAILTDRAGLRPEKGSAQQ